MDTLTKQQIELLRQWARRTDPTKFYYPIEVFSKPTVHDFKKRRIMYRLLETGILRTAKNFGLRIGGGNPTRVSWQRLTQKAAINSK
jgi:hypothetical protein